MIYSTISYLHRNPIWYRTVVLFDLRIEVLHARRVQSGTFRAPPEHPDDIFHRGRVRVLRALHHELVAAHMHLGGSRLDVLQAHMAQL